MNNTGVTGLILPPNTDFEHAHFLAHDRHYIIYILEKWFPLQGERGRSSYFRCFQKQNRVERENKNNKPINLPKVITFSTDFKYTTINTYIFCSSQLLMIFF